MIPVLANPAGLWALLAVPVVLAIHFLQQRSRLVRTSTWFLIEPLAPDSKRGTTWERLRASRQLWLQLAAAIVAAWVLATPRWIRSESAQTVAIVLDASASMEAFRAGAIAAAEREMDISANLARHTTWVVMTTDARQPSLYRGTERVAASAALATWQPSLGEHDSTPTLRLARGLAGTGGRTLFITDARRKTFEGQHTEGVGKPIENVGFSGVTVDSTRTDSGWRALVRNYGGKPQRRVWHVESTAGAGAEQAIDLPAGGMREITGKFPAGTDEITLVLSGDAFPLDDRLPLERPVPKPLAVRVDGTDDISAFFRKVADDVDGIRLVTAGAPAALRIAALGADAASQERTPGIYRPPERAPGTPATLSNESLTPERSPLVSDVSWQGWLGTGPQGFPFLQGDTPLLWQGRSPLVFLRPTPAGGRKLMLGFDWTASNAERMPAMVLLIRRFLEEQRDNQPAFYAAQFDCSDPVPLRGVLGSAEPYTLQTRFSAGGSDKRTLTALELSSLRAPQRPGFFALRRGESEIVRGAAQFADPRQSDFRSAETFTLEQPGDLKAAMERNTRPDPLAPVWLALLAALAIASWYEAVRKTPAIPRKAAVA